MSKLSGDRFEIYRMGRLWHWRLVIAHSPFNTPAAVSGRGYPSKPAVLRAIAKAIAAAAAASKRDVESV